MKPPLNPDEFKRMVDDVLGDNVYTFVFNKSLNEISVRLTNDAQYEIGVFEWYKHPKKWACQLILFVEDKVDQRRFYDDMERILDKVLNLI